MDASIYVFWAAIGLALLSKGPTTLAVLAPIALARLLLDTPRDLSWPQRILRLWPGRGWYLAVLIGLPWYAYVAWADWSAFAHGFIGANMIDRVSRGIEGHSGPPGYYIVTTLAAVLPWTPVVIAAVVAAWRSRRTDGDARRLLIWLAAPWPLFELIATKLPHYVLPLFPPAAMLAGCWLAQRTVSRAYPTRDSSRCNPHPLDETPARSHRRNGRLGSLALARRPLAVTGVGASSPQSRRRRSRQHPCRPRREGARQGV